MKKIKWQFLVGSLLLVVMVGSAVAYSGYLSTFRTQYAATETVLNTCSLCHPGGDTGNLNNYAQDFANNGYNYAAIENLDSDGDGYSNLAEINARTFPGDAASFPAPAPLGNDVNNDGISDVFLSNSVSGQVSLWLMNNDGTMASDAVLITNLDWTIVGTGDVNKDGQADLLWRNSTTGQSVLWFMNADGTRMGAAKTLLTDVSWTIVGTGDVNADGVADILWENSASGQSIIWFMNADGTRASFKLLLASTDWAIVATGDYNGDGKRDILWRNASTGQVVMWFMNANGTRAGFKILYTNPYWTVVP